MNNNTQNPFEEALTTKASEHNSTKTLKKEEPVEVHPYVESMLDTLSYTLLVIGGISFIVFFILAGAPQGYLDDWFEDFNWVTFSIGLGTALTQTVFFCHTTSSSQHLNQTEQLVFEKVHVTSEQFFAVA